MASMKPFYRQVTLVAFRELRHNKAAFSLSAFTVLLATLMLTAILGLGDSLRTTLAKDARNILGGDFEIRRATQNFTPNETNWLSANADRISPMITVRAAGFTDNLTSLLILRVVEDNYPLNGQIILAGEREYSSDLLTQGIANGIPSVIDKDLAGSLGLSIGGTFQLGQATLSVVEIIDRIPDPSATMLLNAPVVLISAQNFDATGPACARHVENLPHEN